MMFGKARLHLLALIAATAFLLVWPGQQAGAQDPPWHFSPDVHVEVDGYWVGSEEHIYINSNLYANDVMFDAWVQFTPADWFVATGADVPDGAHVGDAWTGMSLGLLNGPCSTWLDFGVRMLDCTTNTAVTVSFEDGFLDANANGLPDACDKYPIFLKTLFPGITPRARYYAQYSVAGSPTSLNLVVFEPGTALPGLPTFDSSLGYPLVTVLNDPTAPPAPSPITDVCTNVQWNQNFWPRSGDNPDTAADESGYLLRQNPSDWGNYNFATFARPRPDADWDGIENQLDTCPFDPNWDENPRNGNGPDGDGIDSVCDPEWDVADVDEDGDGYMNRGDNCPLVANGLSEDNQLDSDGDGIGDVCDTEGNGPYEVDGALPDRWLYFGVEVTGDSDGDGWSDALERLAGSSPGWDLSTPEGLWRTAWTCADGLDNDLDGLMDGYDLGCDRDNDRVANMFDACPEDPEDWDGFEDADGCPEADNDRDGICDPWYGQSSCWGSDGCPNVPEDYDSYRDWDGCPEPDNDDDGFPDVTDECPGTDWTAGPDGIADSGDEPPDRHGIPIQTKEDYDGIIDWDGCHDSPGDDYDADGFSDEVETYIGTDPTDGCTDEPGYLDAWPFDNNIDTWSNVLDILLYKGHLQIPASDPGYVQRFDINADEWVNVLDILLYKGHLQVQCTNP